MTDERKRTPARGLVLSDKPDRRDELVPKHPGPHQAAPHIVPFETTGVHVRQRVDSISTSIEQLKLDQIRQNNQQEAQADAIAHVSGRVDLLDVKLDGVDGKLDIVTDLVRNRARTDTAHLEAELKIKTVDHEDRAGRTKLQRTAIGALLAALGAIAGAAAHYLAGGG